MLSRWAVRDPVEPMEDGRSPVRGDPDGPCRKTSRHKVLKPGLATWPYREDPRVEATPFAGPDVAADRSVALAESSGLFSGQDPVLLSCCMHHRPFIATWCSIFEHEVDMKPLAGREG